MLTALHHGRGGESARLVSLHTQLLKQCRENEKLSLCEETFNVGVLALDVNNV